MKKNIIALLFSVFLISSCAYKSEPPNVITSIQIRTRDISTIRPRIISLLGRDSAGFDAVSLITTYEDFLASNYPIDTTDQTPPEAPKNINYWRWDIEPPDPINIQPEAPNNPKKPKMNIATNSFLQLLHQQCKLWIKQLNDFHEQYYKTYDIGHAKKGVASGYNALLSGPTVSEIQKIEEKLMPLIDTLQAAVKKRSLTIDK
jgi:hypothetical protein